MITPSTNTLNDIFSVGNIKVPARSEVNTYWQCIFLVNKELLKRERRKRFWDWQVVGLLRRFLLLAPLFDITLDSFCWGISHHISLVGKRTWGGTLSLTEIFFWFSSDQHQHISVLKISSHFSQEIFNSGKHQLYHQNQEISLYLKNYLHRFSS